MVNLKKDLAEMQEWMAQAEEDYLERDFEYKSPEELGSAVEEMKVRLDSQGQETFYLPSSL